MLFKNNAAHPLLSSLASILLPEMQALTLTNLRSCVKLCCRPAPLEWRTQQSPLTLHGIVCARPSTLKFKNENSLLVADRQGTPLFLKNEI